MAASELDDSRIVDVEYSIVPDSSEDRSVREYFSIDSSTGIVSTKAALAQFGMLLTCILQMMVMVTKCREFVWHLLW